MMLLHALLTFGLLLQAKAAPEKVVSPVKSWVAVVTKSSSKECRRVTDATEWESFWKEHSGAGEKAPEVDFQKHMVLVYPREVSCCDGIQSKSLTVLEGEARLRVVLEIALMALGKPHNPGDKPRLTLTIVVLPRSDKPVEFLPAPGAKPDGALPAAVAAGMTMRGKLERKNLEGGVWTLTWEGKLYDLHGDLKGFKPGDFIEVKGDLDKGVCVHMHGIPFRVASVRTATPEK